MNLYEFVRNHLPIISEKRLFFRPKITWFTTWKFLATFLIFFSFIALSGIFIYNFHSFSIASVLGTSVSQDKQTAQKEKIYQEIQFWQAIVAQFPNYRDAYLKLAILSWEVHLDGQAIQYLDHAREIDPNNENLKKIEILFQK